MHNQQYQTWNQGQGGQSIADTHRNYALLHQQHAQAHQQHAQYHQQQAHLHSQRASQINSIPYDERTTANANVVSPAALVFHGHVSPEAIRSLQQYTNPVGSQQFSAWQNAAIQPSHAHGVNMAMAPIPYPVAHSTDANWAKRNSGYRF